MAKDAREIWANKGEAKHCPKCGAQVFIIETDCAACRHQPEREVLAEQNSQPVSNVILAAIGILLISPCSLFFGFISLMLLEEEGWHEATVPFVLFVGSIAIMLLIAWFAYHSHQRRRQSEKRSD